MFPRILHSLLWAVSFPFVGFLVWVFLFGMAGAMLKDGSSTRSRTASDLEGFAVLTGMLLVLILGLGGGIGGWIWWKAGTGSALGHLVVGVLSLAVVIGILLWLWGVPHWTLV